MENKEVWRKYKKSPKGVKYYVSTRGNVIAVYNNYLKTTASKTTHGYMSIKKKGFSEYVHRMVAETFLDKPEGYYEVNHIDGNKSNNSIKNLEWCDRAGNIRHALKTGLMKGTSMAKINREDAEKIREMYKNGIKVVDIAPIFSLSVRTIYNIIREDTWI